MLLTFLYEEQAKVRCVVIFLFHFYETFRANTYEKAILKLKKLTNYLSEPHIFMIEYIKRQHGDGITSLPL